MNYTKKLLRYLEKNAGKKIKIKEILGYINQENQKSNQKQFNRKSKGRHGDKKKNQFVSKLELESTLVDLGQLKGLEFSKKGMTVRQPFVFRGTVSLSPRGMAFIKIRGMDAQARDVFISARDARGLLPEDVVLIRLVDKSRDRFEGRVIKVLKRGREKFRLKLLAKPQEGKVIGEVLDTNVALQACVDVSRMPKDSMQRLQIDSIIVASLEEDDVRFKGAYFKSAQFIRFEDQTKLDPEFARILMKYNLEPVYPASIKLPNQNQVNGDRELGGKNNRQDMRHLESITIDGADSKDFDDALSLQDDENDKNLWKLYVHIADVSHYVKRDTDLDKEARTRSTSYYLSGRVVPMLPPVLSENLCSLVAGKDRLAFTAVMLIRKKDGKILRSEFFKSVIKVDHRLTYTTAEEMIQNKPEAKNHPVFALVQELYKLALKQKQMRMKSGRVDLDLPEPWFKTNPKDRDKIESVGFRERLESSILIEECMLSANTAVAEFLRKKKAHVLYRTHDPISQEKRERLNTFMMAFQIPFEFKDAGYTSLNKAYELVENHIGSDSLKRIYFMQLLRSFMQAVYNPEPVGHWGLGFKDYCHFTSPIRRYPDLVVHRALESLLGKGKQAYNKNEIQDLAEHTSEQERRAMDAERDITKLKLIAWIKYKKITSFTGYINGFKSNRVYLELEGIPGEAQVDAIHLDPTGELSNEDPYRVFIKKLGKPARLGDKWELILDRLDPEKMMIFCKPVFE